MERNLILMLIAVGLTTATGSLVAAVQQMLNATFIVMLPNLDGWNFGSFGLFKLEEAVEERHSRRTRHKTPSQNPAPRVADDEDVPTFV